jgi:hypothetical protein
MQTENGLDGKKFKMALSNMYLIWNIDGIIFSDS